MTTTHTKNKIYSGNRKNDRGYLRPVILDAVTIRPPAAPVADEPGSVDNNAGTYSALWELSATATSYVVQQSSAPNFSVHVSTYTVGNTHVLDGLVVNMGISRLWYYRVRAVNAAGTSGNSNVITVDFN